MTKSKTDTEDEASRKEASDTEQHRGNMSRRRFAKYVSGTVIAATALYAGRYLIPPATRFDCRTANRTLDFIAPHSGEVIEFINRTEEPAFLPAVSYSWSVDDRVTSSDRNYSCSLTETPMGRPHTIQLTGSRGFVGASFRRQLEVDPETVPQYPERKLGIPVKGISYVVGMKGWDMPPVTDEEIAVCLAIIKEAGCNGIRIVGDYEDRIIKCAELCVGKFDTITLSPFSWDMTLSEIESSRSKLAEAAETLRVNSSSTRVILSIGNELSYEMVGIVPGKDYDERNANVDKAGGLTTDQVDKLNQILSLICTEVKGAYGGEISYESSMVDGKEIDWNQIGVDVLAPHGYFETQWTTEDEYLATIDWFIQKASGKPVLISEFGYFTFDDALRWGGSGNQHLDSRQYSQEAQADALDQNLELLNRTRVDGIFLWDLLEKKDDIRGQPGDMRSPGIIRWNKNGMWTRKLSFYEYQRWKV